jgi:tRNA threonylcarbamoyl adenosine modification protein (Sua5/YciO/YrdC/YwlC family)
MLVQLHPDNPFERTVKQVVDILNDGGVIIFPTDTVYALACAIDSKRGFERICRIKRIEPRKAIFSMIADSITMASPYLYQLFTPAFRILNRNLPGPFTFVVRSSKQIPSHARNGRKTIGLRIPDHEVSRAIVSALGKPLITTSLKSGDEILEYYNDPENIHKELGHAVDLVVASGPGDFYPSTVVDLLTDEPEIIRQGKGELKL